LGNGTTNGNTTANATPNQEATAGTSWTTLGTGPATNFSLVRTPSAQYLASAGQNNAGQLGDGTTTDASRFDRVSPLTSLQPLPVVLTQFTATAQGPAVALAWTTASEVNSARFEIERSLDGTAFTKAGEVAAAGSSSVAHAYALLYATLPAGASWLYYCLRQVDADGSAHYSPVRGIMLAGAGLSLYPNPATAEALLLGAHPSARVQVLDAMGRLVLSTAADASGIAVLALPSGLPSGVYVVRAGQLATRLTVQ
jgi:hypothetical protein